MTDTIQRFIRKYAVFIAILGFVLAVGGVIFDNETLADMSILTSRTLLILVFLTLFYRREDS